MPDLFAGAVAAVTGGASGIGFALARTLAGRGANVAIIDISGEQADAAAQTIGGSARAYQCDVTDKESLDAVADEIRGDFGMVNYIFANAGVVAQGELCEMDPADFAWLFDVNVRGTYNTICIFKPHLIEQAGLGWAARFVITGSECSLALPSQGSLAAYVATKHALLGLADGLRRDFEDSGVGVSIFCPGPVSTNLWDARRARQDRYGGAASLEDEVAQASSAAFATFTSPEITARLCLAGIENEEFLIITDQKIREMANKRQAEVRDAFAKLEERAADLG